MSLHLRRCLLPAVLAVLSIPEPVVAQTSPPAAVNSRHEGLKHRADEAYRASDFDSVISLTSQVLSESPNDPVALYLRASAQVDQGIAAGDADRIRAGIADARSAIQADSQKKPDYYMPYLYGMSYLTKLEQNPSHAESALATATQVLQRQGLPRQAKANLLYQRGIANTQLQRYEGAVDDFRRAIEASSKHLAARMALCDALVQSGDIEEADEAFNRAARTFPDSPLVLNNRGMFHQSQGNLRRAIRDFTLAISLDADYVQAYMNRGYTQLQKSDPAAAIDDLNAVLEREPNNAAALSLRGTAKLRQGQFKESIADYTRVVERNPADPAARADLGFAYFFSGDYKTAAAAFDQSLTLKPDNDFLKPWRYTALVRSGQEDRTRSSYAALRQKPVERQSWFDALTLHLMGELSEDELIGRVESRDARLKDAQICEAYYFIGVAKQTTDPEEAAASFRRALSSEATQLSAYQAARIAVEEQDAAR